MKVPATFRAPAGPARELWLVRGRDGEDVVAQMLHPHRASPRIPLGAEIWTGGDPWPHVAATGGGPVRRFMAKRPSEYERQARGTSLPRPSPLETAMAGPRASRGFVVQEAQARRRPCHWTLRPSKHDARCPRGRIPRGFSPDSRRTTGSRCTPRDTRSSTSKFRRHDPQGRGTAAARGDEIWGPGPRTTSRSDRQEGDGQPSGGERCRGR